MRKTFGSKSDLFDQMRFFARKEKLGSSSKNLELNLTKQRESKQNRVVGFLEECSCVYQENWNSTS